MTELISNIKVIRYSMFQNNAAADTDTFSGILFGKLCQGTIQIFLIQFRAIYLQRQLRNT